MMFIDTEFVASAKPGLQAAPFSDPGLKSFVLRDMTPQSWQESYNSSLKR